MLAVHVPRGWTVEEYLRLERESPVKDEYVDGHVYAIAGGTQAHSELGAAAVALLRSMVRGGPCRAFNSDLKVQVSPHIYSYPDASVSCDPRDRHPDARDIQYPTLVLEVTSLSTADYDREEKFDQYCTSASLREYVLVDHRRVAVEVRTRGDDGMWHARHCGSGEIVELHSLAATVAADAFYEDVTLEG
jgi:Uma2 family endonuclease